MNEQLKQFDIGSLKPEEFDAWCELCGRIFPPSPEYFRRHFKNDPDAHIEDIFVARKDGELVASVRLFTRSVWLGGKVARVGGIGEVCSDPCIRGLGVSYYLLDMAMKTADARGWELGALYTGRHSHYARHGFAVAPRIYKNVKVADLPQMKGEYEVRAFEAADLDAVMGLFDLYSSQFDLMYRRASRAYWEKWILAEWKNPMVLIKDGHVIAYADVPAGEGTLFVRDAGMIPGEDATLGTLLKAAAEKQGCESVVMPEPVMPEAKGEVQEPNRGLMMRMPQAAFGFENVEDMAEKAEKTIVQWAVDGF